MSGLLAIAAWVVIAPMVTVSPDTVIPASPSFARSMTVLGLFSRCLSTGMKVWPPASTFASMSADRSLTASARLPGFSYAKSYMVMFPLASLLGRQARLRGLDDGPELGSGCRHVQMPHTVILQRIDDGIDHRRWRSDRPDL